MPENLEGLVIEIVVTDPWDFGTVHGTGPFKARILKVSTEEAGRQSMLIRLDTLLTFEGVECEFFVAGPRHVGNTLDVLLKGDSVFCSMTRIPPERANHSNPFDLSWWRGGIGLIATITPSIERLDN